jgi:hypothetical protein
MKKIVFGLLIASLLFPMLQEHFQIVKEKQLTGFVPENDKPELNRHNWLSGDFQEKFSKLKDDNYGFRSFFIRLFNQIDFSLFSKTHAEVTCGKKNYLFQLGYIYEYNGRLNVGNEVMKNNISKLKKIQNYLSEKNITLLTVVAPTKSDYFSEYQPSYAGPESPDRNYKLLVRDAKEADVRLIDFNHWFLQLKDTTRYPLFPQYGIHWNFYGMTLCADSIVKYLRKERNENLRKMSWTLELADSPRGTDYDLGYLLNIFQKLPTKNKIPYPKYIFDADSSGPRPRLLVIADSFYWTIFNEHVFSHIFKNETFFYYYNEAHPRENFPSQYVSDLNMVNEIEKYDVVILLQSGGNYGNPGLNFVQSFDMDIEKLKQGTEADLKTIRSDAELTNLANHWSDSLHITPDLAQKALADFRVKKFLEEVSKVKIQMRGNPDWMNSLTSKSLATQKTIARVMDEDARWIIQSEKDYNGFKQF